MIPADVQWMIVRNSSSYLVKGSKTTFSTEANNLKNQNCYRYNGLIHKKTVGVMPCSDGKGVVLVTKRKGTKRHPARQYAKTELKRGARRTLKSVRNIVDNYRKDLKMAAIRRTSAVLKSQMPVAPSKRTAKPKKE